MIGKCNGRRDASENGIIAPKQSSSIQEMHFTISGVNHRNFSTTLDSRCHYDTREISDG